MTQASAALVLSSVVQKLPAGWGSFCFSCHCLRGRPCDQAAAAITAATGLGMPVKVYAHITGTLLLPPSTHKASDQIVGTLLMV